MQTRARPSSASLKLLCFFCFGVIFSLLARILAAAEPDIRINFFRG